MSAVPREPAPPPFGHPPGPGPDGRPFAARLRAQRRARGWTQAELARRSGLSPDGVWKIESGHHPTLRPASVAALEAALRQPDPSQPAPAPVVLPQPERLPPVDTFGGVLARYRLRGGLSRNELGKRTGVDASYVSRLESGERGAPSRAVVEALARALDLGELARDRLLLAAGYTPDYAEDRTIRQLAAALAGASPEVTAFIRQTVACWYGQEKGGAR